MKRFYCLSISLLFFLLIYAQNSKQAQRSNYEYQLEIPVYTDSIQKALTYPLAFRNYPDHQQWHEAARSKILSLMGPSAPRPHAWNVQVIEQEQRAGYQAQLIELSLSQWYRVRALLLIPNKGNKHPAVNLLHDHGAHLFIGKEKMIKPIGNDTVVNNDADRWVHQLYEGQYLGDYLARNGYVVISADAPLWGDRGRREGVDRKKYDIIAGNMMMLGRNLCAQMHYDDMMLTEFLSQLPQVDTTKIGCAGCSMGAYRAWMLAALSPYIKAACAICWMTTTNTQLTQRYGRAENGGFANCIPLLRNYLDYPDIASLASPKPMLFVSGTRDKLFQVEGVKQAFTIMHDVWNAHQAADNLETYLLDQPHECNLHNQEQILHFLNKHLR